MEHIREWKIEEDDVIVGVMEIRKEKTQAEEENRDKVIGLGNNRVEKK